MTAYSRACAMLVAVVCAAAGRDKFDVYYLVIGSEHYVGAAAPGVNSLPTIDGMRKSALAVAGVLDGGGSAFGITLLSDSKHFVSVRDIDTGLNALVKRVRDDRPAKPLLVFYFAGHGVSEGVAWNHFSLPGNFAYRGSLGAQTVEGLAKVTLHASELVDRLEKGGVPFLLLLDTCYEGKPESFRSPVLTGPAVESLRATAAVLRFMNEFHEAGQVLFSTQPGTTVSPSPDPRDPDPKTTGVAPLARRFLLIAGRVRLSQQPLSLGEFVTNMVSPDLDPATGPAVTHSQLAPQGDFLLSIPEPVKGRRVEMTGTATNAAVCCAPRR